MVVQCQCSSVEWCVFECATFVCQKYRASVRPSYLEGELHLTYWVSQHSQRKVDCDISSFCLKIIEYNKVMIFRRVLKAFNQKLKNAQLSEVRF